jgi:hypothetical protein
LLLDTVARSADFLVRAGAFAAGAFAAAAFAGALVAIRS